MADFRNSSFHVPQNRLSVDVTLHPRNAVERMQVVSEASSTIQPFGKSSTFAGICDLSLESHGSALMKIIT